jgi:hypothetical protein
MTMYPNQRVWNAGGAEAFQSAVTCAVEISRLIVVSAGLEAGCSSRKYSA